MKKKSSSKDRFAWQNEDEIIIERSKETETKSRPARLDIIYPQSATKTIRKVDDKWVIYSQDGKRLGEFDSKNDAEKRLSEIEYFKKRETK